METSSRKKIIAQQSVLSRIALCNVIQYTEYIEYIQFLAVIASLAG